MNIAAKLHTTIGALRSHHRLVLSGTPMTESMNGLWTLMHFLHPKILNSPGAEKFDEWWWSGDLPKMEELCLTEEEQGIVANRIKDVLTRVTLRRTKEEAFKDLQPKDEMVAWVQMTPWQEKMYDCMRNHTIDHFGDIHGNSMGGFNNLCFELQKVTSHPPVWLN